MNNKVEDGIYTVYVLDGIAYPMVVTKDQHTLIQMVVAGIVDNNIKLVKALPLGQAENILPKLRADAKKNKEGLK